MAGGFRDPMVGRDILIGGLLGFGHTSAIYFMALMPVWLGGYARPNPGANPDLYGIRMLLSGLLANSVSASIMIGMSFMFLLLLFYVFLRKQWLAAFALGALMFSVLFLAFSFHMSWVALTGPMMIAAIYIFALVRFGLLAVMALQLFFTLSFHYPLTSDFSNWYAGTTIFSGLIILSLSVYGFYVSIAGQPLFGSGLLSDDQ